MTHALLPLSVWAALLVAGITAFVLARDAAVARARFWHRRLGSPEPRDAWRLPGRSGQVLQDLLWRAGIERPDRGVVLAVLLPVLLPIFQYRAGRRSAQLRAQLPDGLEMLVEGLRIGQGLQASWQTVAMQWPDPLGREWRRVQAEMALGLAWSEAIAGMARRTPMPEHDLLVRAVALQQRTGAPLADVLARLVDTMRERAELEGELAALTAQGRLSGWVLGALPFCVAALMAFLAPAHIGDFLTHPVGRQMALLALLAQGLGVLAMRRVLRLEDG